MRLVDLSLLACSLAVGVFSAEAAECADSLLTKNLRMQSVPAKIRIADFPAIGESEALVILAEFEDVRFSAAEDIHGYFEGLLNKEGFTYGNGASGSARDFYIASSDGQFLPNFVVVGPVTLPHTRAWYGADDNGWLDYNAHIMVADACKIIDPDIDFTRFDMNRDGEVDNVYVYFAGRGQSDTGDSDDLWPQSNTLYDNKEVDLVLDGVRINHYAFSNEIRLNDRSEPEPVGIGTFVHEFGHVLGISDHYDSTFAGKRPGVDQWDTMAAANYFNNMHTPPLFSAFERAELGWLEYVELTDAYDGEKLFLRPLTEENRAFRVIVPDTDGNEYYVLENRQQYGWDRFLPGHGLLVWHIDMDYNAWMGNKVNTDPDHNRVDIVEADGYESPNNLAGDTFPGKRKVTSFDFKDWQGETAFSISDVFENEDGGVEFTFHSGLTSVDSVTSDEIQSVSVCDLTGRAVSDSYCGVVIVKRSDGSCRKYIRR